MSLKSYHRLILGSIVVFLSLFFLSHRSIHAQSDFCERDCADDPNPISCINQCSGAQTYNDSIDRYNQAYKSESQNIEINSYNSVEGIQAAAGCLLGAEVIGLECPNAPQTGELASNSNGLLGVTTAITGSLFEVKPASTQQFVAYALRSMNIQPQAQAQGIGFASLEPILNIWIIFRNIAYLFFVVLFLFIGFMIMFRQKIGSQSAVTLQQAIPSILIALVFVTFSYAIAGFFIDIMYLSMFLLAGFFGRTDLISGNVFDIAIRFITTGGAAQGGAAIGDFVGNAIGLVIIKEIATVITNLTATIVILFIIVFNAFRLLFNLLKVYVEIILAIAFSPLILMTGAIPGQNPFKKWAQSLIANLAVFPMILLLLIVFSLLSDNTVNIVGTGFRQVSGTGFLPPYISGIATPNLIPFLAGLGLILSLPDAINKIREALGATKGGLFAGLMEQGIGDIYKKRQIGTEALWKIPSTAYYAQLARKDPSILESYGLGGLGRGTPAATAAGAALGLVGATRAARTMNKFRKNWGEFAENDPSGADSTERFFIEKIRFPLTLPFRQIAANIINPMRARRQSPPGTLTPT